MATLTPPIDPKFSTFYGDLDLLAPGNVDSGTGTIYIRSGGLYTEGLTDLNQTTINTTTGEFNISGTNKINANMTSSIELTATAASFFTTTAGTLSLNATATNANGKIAILAAGTGTDTINISSTNATSGQVHIQSAGASIPSVIVEATDAAGQTLIQSAGTGLQAVKLNATAGGIYASATGKINITTTNTANGITIGTDTLLVPITIGTIGSLTTIGGDLLVAGTTVSVNTTSLNFDDNAIILNSGNTVSGYNASLAIRRYQTPNDTPTGNLPGTEPPVQEFGTAQAGTTSTITLAAYASAANEFYKNWWILITTGTGANQIRRIKSYVGSTKVATIYLAADNAAPPPGYPTTFSDGLVFSTAPDNTSVYNLFSSGYPATFYDEADCKWKFYTVANVEDGITASTIQQTQDLLTGAIDVKGKIYNNASFSSAAAVTTISIKDHGLIVGNYVKLSNSANSTPAITSGLYAVIAPITANTFTITAQASIVSAVDSSITVYFYNSSIVKANVITSYDPEFPISIPGASIYQDIIITKTSVLDFPVTLTAIYGAYLLLICDTSGTGAAAVFAASNNGSTSNPPSRIVSSVGGQNQRISARWTSAAVINIFQSTAGTGLGTYTYRVRILSCI
jgi:hypothetical protein